MISVKIQNIGTLIKTYQTASKKIDDKLKRRVEAALRIVQRNSMREAPVGQYPKGSGRVGGTLRQSIKYRTISKTVGVVEAGAEYAGYVHEGTRFMRGNPFMDRGVKLSEQKIIDEIGLGVKAAVASFDS